MTEHKHKHYNKADRVDSKNFYTGCVVILLTMIIAFVTLSQLALKTSATEYVYFSINDHKVVKIHQKLHKGQTYVLKAWGSQGVAKVIMYIHGTDLRSESREIAKISFTPQELKTYELDIIGLDSEGSWLASQKFYLQVIEQEQQQNQENQNNQENEDQNEEENLAEKAFEQKCLSLAGKPGTSAPPYFSIKALKISGSNKKEIKIYTVFVDFENPVLLEMEQELKEDDPLKAVSKIMSSHELIKNFLRRSLRRVVENLEPDSIIILHVGYFIGSFQNPSPRNTLINEYFTKYYPTVWFSKESDAKVFNKALEDHNARVERFRGYISAHFKNDPCGAAHEMACFVDVLPNEEFLISTGLDCKEAERTLFRKQLSINKHKPSPEIKIEDGNGQE